MLSTTVFKRASVLLKVVDHLTPGHGERDAAVERRVLSGLTA